MKTLRTLLSLLIFSGLTACGGGGGVACGSLLGSVCNSEKTNTAPVASAGTLQNITLDVPATINGVSKLTKQVTLDGSYSTDAETTSLNLTYKWIFSEKPSGSIASLSDSSAVKPSFTADTTGTYKITLVVNDGKLDSSEASVVVVASISNSAPVANAGAKQTVAIGSTVMLDGTQSTDSDLSDPRIYKWVLLSAPATSSAKILDTSSPRPTFVADKAGDYIASLVVSDGKQESPTSTVIVTASAANIRPQAVASANLTSVNLGTEVVLDATKSTDQNNDMLTYSWAWISYPSTSAPSIDSASARPKFTPSVAGAYVLMLTVNDTKQDSLAVPITINASSSNAPVAVAGNDQFVTLSSSNTVTLNGSGSYDPDFGQTATLSYKWSLSRPASDTSAVLVGATTSMPTFFASKEGVYVASLIVTDSVGNVSAVSQVRVIASASNSPPIANAGPKQSVTSTTVTLSGSGTDADGNSLTYSWSVQSVPVGGTATLSSTTAQSPTATISSTAGNYVFKLIVNDGTVDSAPHTVTITKS
jgi:hypothetical protein